MRSLDRIYAARMGSLLVAAASAADTVADVARRVARRVGGDAARTAGMAALVAAVASASAPARGEASARYSVWQTTVTRGEGGTEPDFRGALRHNLLTTTAASYVNGYDWLASAMGNGPAGTFASATGAATATTATSLTNSGATFPTAGNGLAGQIVVCWISTTVMVYGVILSNTGTALTVDQWYSATSTTGAAGTTPASTAPYVVIPGQNPAAWLCLSASVFTPSTADQSLGTQGAELTTNGFSRAVGTWSHTHAASTYTLVHLWTATGTSTINNEGVSGGATYSATTPFGGVFPFESAEPSPPTLVSGDTLQNTITVTI